MGLSNTLNKFWDAVGKFSYTYWTAVIATCVLVAGGGVVAAFFGWPFALIVPLWLLFVAFVMRQNYIRKLK